MKLRAVGEAGEEGEGSPLRKSLPTLSLLELGRLGLMYLLALGFAKIGGASGYGVFTYVQSWTFLVGTVATLGLATASIRFLSVYESRGQTSSLRGYIWFSGVATVSAATVAAIGVLLFAPMATSDAALRDGLRWGSAGIPLFAALTLLSHHTRALGSPVLSRVGPTLILPGSVLVFGGIVGFSTGLDAGRVFVGAFLAGLMVAVASQLFLARRASGWPGMRGEKTWERRAWVGVAAPMVALKGSQVVVSHVDMVLIGYFLGGAEAGIYAIAVKMATAVTLVLQATNHAVGPRVSSAHYGGDVAGVERVLRRGLAWCAICGLGIAVALMLGGPAVFGTLGTEFGASRELLAILLAGYLVHTAVGPLAMVMNVTGHEKMSAALFSGVGIVNVAGNLIFIPIWGLVGAAMVTTVALGTWNLVLYVLVQRLLGVRLPPRQPSRLARA